MGCFAAITLQKISKHFSFERRNLITTTTDIEDPNGYSVTFVYFLGIFFLLSG